MDTVPDDPLGTVRAGDGLLAVRAYSVHPEADNHDLAWFIVNIGAQLEPDMDADQLYTWPVVYQP